MAKLAVILPHGNLTDTTRTLLRIMHMEQAILIRYDGDHTTIPVLVDQARRQGADIIMTRGLIAARVRQHTDIPVVEMRLTAQELGLLIQKAKTLTLRQPATIAIVGTANMFCDYSRLSELFSVTLSSYLIAPDDPDPYASMAKQTEMAVSDHADVIIGGETACTIARARNVPAIFLTATPDSIQEGLRSVRRLSYAINLEKNNASEMQTMLDCSFSILIRFNREGCITTVNRAAAVRLEWKTYDIYGKPILSLLKGISQQQLQQILFTGKTLHSAFITIGEDRFVANVMPIRTAEGNIIGGVLSCDDVRRIETVGMDIRREQRRLQHPAVHSFRDFSFESQGMRAFMDTSVRFAQSESPILIRHETGCYPQVMAECIHNASGRKEMPFVSVNCAELCPEEQLRLLFGSGSSASDLVRSMCALAHMGTLYLENPEYLCPQAQSRLYRLLTQKLLLNTENASPFPLDVRVIASSQKTDAEWAELPDYDPQVRIILSGLTVEIPPLRSQKEALMSAAEACFERYLKKYQRYLSLTEGGKAWFLTQEWPGNFLQLDRFCERLVLSAPRRSVDERLLTALYQETAPIPRAAAQNPPAESGYIAPEAAKITEALTRHLGSRSATAKELGISTSTLWRKMNKYNINL